LNIDAVAGATEDQACSHSFGESTCLSQDQSSISFLHDMISSHLCANFFLILPWKIDKVVVLGADEEGNGGLVETPALTIPLFDAVESAFPSQVKHEENCHCIITDEWQHVDEFALSTKVPYRKGDLSIPNRDGLLHKVDTCIPLVSAFKAVFLQVSTKGLNVVFVPAALDVFDHQTCLADLRIPDHANLYDDTTLVLWSLLPLLIWILSLIPLLTGEARAWP
jgi:hypothetical protein